jgi:hypothetical protein
MRRRVPSLNPGIPKSFAETVARVDSPSDSEGDDGSDSDHGSAEAPGAKPLELPPKPVWNTASVLPAIPGLAAACMDTVRARVCTATGVTTVGGRPVGGELTLWSMRTGEAVARGRLPRDAEGAVPAPRALFYAPGARVFVGLSGLAQLWAASLATLEIVGAAPAHDRRVLAAAFHAPRDEVAVSAADGRIRILAVSVQVVREPGAKARGKQVASFRVVAEWDAKCWCDVLAIQARPPPTAPRCIAPPPALRAASPRSFRWPLRRAAPPQSSRRAGPAEARPPPCARRQARR